MFKEIDKWNFSVNLMLGCWQICWPLKSFESWKEWRNTATCCVAVIWKRPDPLKNYVYVYIYIYNFSGWNVLQFKLQFHAELVTDGQLYQRYVLDNSLVTTWLHAMRVSGERFGSIWLFPHAVFSPCTQFLLLFLKAKPYCSDLPQTALDVFSTLWMCSGTTWISHSWSAECLLVREQR